MKEVIGKARKTQSLLPSKILVNNIEINNEFNNFFIDIGPELAKENPRPARSFESCVPNSNSNMPTGPISANELKNAFFSIKTNKCLGHDEINFNVVRSCFGELCERLQYLFNLSFEKSIFPDDLKIAKFTPVFKAGNNTELSNYRPISVPCFSKILERVMHNRLFKYLLDSNILYKKQFGFQEEHSTDHAILQLVDEMYNTFEQNNFTLGVFIDLPKTYESLDHNILLKKLEINRIVGETLKWFKNYLNNRKHIFR